MKIQIHSIFPETISGKKHSICSNLIKDLLPSSGFLLLQYMRFNYKLNCSDEKNGRELNAISFLHRPNGQGQGTPVRVTKRAPASHHSAARRSHHCERVEHLGPSSRSRGGQHSHLQPPQVQSKSSEDAHVLLPTCPGQPALYLWDHAVHGHLPRRGRAHGQKCPLSDKQPHS